MMSAWSGQEHRLSLVMTIHLLSLFGFAAAYSVKTILQSIQSLLADPNIDSPLNVQAAKLWGHNDAEYKVMVQKLYHAAKQS